MVVTFVGGTYWVGTQLTKPARAQIGESPDFLSAEDVRFPSATGVSLGGWYVPGRRECGSVVLMHAVGGNRSAMIGRARFLTHAGYAVLLFDFQAHGESDGNAITYGAREKDDARAAVQFVAKRHPSAPIGVIGFSLGGVAAVLNGPALGADAIVLEAVYSSFAQALTNRVRLYTGPLAYLLAQPLLMYLQRRFGLSPQELRPIDHIASLGTPVFILGGSEDQRTMLSETQELFSTARSPKKLWVLKGARHQDLHSYNSVDYQTKVLAFLDEHVGCEPHPSTTDTAGDTERDVTIFPHL